MQSAINMNVMKKIKRFIGKKLWKLLEYIPDVERYKCLYNRIYDIALKLKYNR